MIPPQGARLLRFLAAGLGAGGTAVILPEAASAAEADAWADTLAISPRDLTLLQGEGVAPSEAALVFVAAGARLGERLPDHAIVVAERTVDLAALPRCSATFPLAPVSGAPKWTIAWATGGASGCASEGMTDAVREQIAEVEAVARRWRPLPSESGALVRVLAAARRPKRALEIGSGEGASTMWLGSGVAATGTLVSIERDSARFASARKRLNRTGLDAFVDLRLGEAERILPKLQGRFDVVLLDGDVEARADHFALVAQRASRRAVVFSRGGVGQAAQLSRYQALVRTHPAVRAEITLAVGDGLSIAVLD